MRKILMGLYGLTVLLWNLGCAKMDTEFRDFFNDDEIIYTGAVGEVINSPGNLRTELKWKASSDPSIVKYVIYWNEKEDSVVVNVAGKTDSIKAMITGLDEYSYAFTIHSFDAKGNRSIPREVNNVKVYGNAYTNSLLNRAIDADRPYSAYTTESTILNFLDPDTINIKTVVRYEDVSGQQIEKELGPNEHHIELINYKLGTDILYKSFFIPERSAIDTFAVNDFDVFPEYMYQNVECDKSLFAEVSLPHDVSTLSESPLKNLWDGRRETQGYPKIYHSQGNIAIPHTLTFDMGKVYTDLTQFEEIGRDCCHNPAEFEVWGIADITDAATDLPANDSGWKEESQQKGWTLLADVIRDDDGSAPKMFNIIANPPPVRYIRIRVKRTTNGDSWQSNMSEITFWNYQ